CNAVDCQGNGTVSVLLNQGNGTFAAAQLLDAGAPQTASVAISDLNGDSIPDLVLENHCSDSNCIDNGVSVLLGKGNGAFQSAQLFHGGGSTNFQNVSPPIVVADVNGDSRPDVVIGANCGLTDST